MNGTAIPNAPAGPRAAMVIAHPGHELRIHGWVARERPLVFVLTDGSGAAGIPRVESSRRTLAALGAEPAALFGRYTDARLYQAILDGDRALFLSIADEIAERLAAERIGLVAGDAAEGYNPVHDVCRLVLDRAADAAGRRLGRPLRNLEFPLMARPDSFPPHLAPEAIRLRLDDAEFARKLAAADSYPELAAELLAARTAHGDEFFRTEWLWPAGRGSFPEADVGTPFYEAYGERQVAAGRYRTVIRRREHIAPLAAALAAPLPEAR